VLSSARCRGAVVRAGTSHAVEAKPSRPSLAEAGQAARPEPIELLHRSQRHDRDPATLAMREGRSMRAYITVAGMAVSLVAVWAALVPFVA
jgi:hypothetical protein